MAPSASVRPSPSDAFVATPSHRQVPEGRRRRARAPTTPSRCLDARRPTVAMSNFQFIITCRNCRSRHWAIPPPMRRGGRLGTMIVSAGVLLAAAVPAAPAASTRARHKVGPPVVRDRQFSLRLPVASSVLRAPQLQRPPCQVRLKTDPLLTTAMRISP
jgi:hypothetical protein